jgi:sterol desaturase/sphingolipid hydroxylase (fatty acid hydroxylase superfamily)
MPVDELSEVEPLLRFGAFVAIFVAVAVWEALAPRRRLRWSRARRWPHNLGLLALDVIVVRFLAPGAAIGVAVLAAAEGWGLLQALALPEWVAVVSAVLALDLAIYGQHILFHRVPLLWRLHRVHHTDTDFDVTTGTRFHPVEILLSLGIKCAVIMLLGAPPLAVLIFEVVLNVTSMFNHANARLPDAVDSWLRWLLVTPDMHRVHHSVVGREMNSNFGFNVPWWDRLFGTYRAQPLAGHSEMRIGVDGFDAPDEVRLARLLVQPLHEPDPGPLPFQKEHA